MTPEQRQVLERASRMLKRSLKDFKRIVFDFAPEGQKDSVHFEIHGKTKVEAK